MSQGELFGIGSLEKLKDILQENAPRRIFFVTQKELLKVLNLEEQLRELLKGYAVSFFFDVKINPDIVSLTSGIQTLHEYGADLVIALGGGSVMDTAKAIALLSQQKGNAEEYVTQAKPIGHLALPVIAIPTSSGTGAEATHFAVVYIGKTKYSLAHESMLPSYAIIDPALTFSLPASITAATGMDALAQCIEAYWSVNSNEESKQYAEEAISLILENLLLVVKSPTPESRSAMSKAAHLSGKAINIAQTTACHAISYPFTSYYGIPHGHAVGLTLPSMIEYNAQVTKEDCQDQRGAEYVKNGMQKVITLLGAKDATEAKEKIEQLMDEIGLERKLSRLGIATDEDINLIIVNGFNPQRMKNNPRQVTREALKSLLEQIR